MGDERRLRGRRRLERGARGGLSKRRVPGGEPPTGVRTQPGGVRGADPQGRDRSLGIAGMGDAMAGVAHRWRWSGAGRSPDGAERGPTQPQVL